MIHSQHNLVTGEMQSRERYFVPASQSVRYITKDVEKLYFCGYGSMVRLSVLNFSSFGFTQLRSITIGNGCFQNVHDFVLDGMEELESVEIGHECFIVSNTRHKGSCRITNCPKLLTVEIRSENFAHFKEFELSNANSLQSIKLGNSCFPKAESCILKGERKE